MEKFTLKIEIPKWTQEKIENLNDLIIMGNYMDAEAETPILWPLHVNSWLIGKDPDAESDWGQEENLSKLRELVMDREAWVLRFVGSQRVGHDWVELNWTDNGKTLLKVIKEDSKEDIYHA